MYCDVLWCDVMWRDVMWCDVICFSLNRLTIWILSFSQCILFFALWSIFHLPSLLISYLNITDYFLSSLHQTHLILIFCVRKRWRGVFKGVTTMTRRPLLLSSNRQYKVRPYALEDLFLLPPSLPSLLSPSYPPSLFPSILPSLTRTLPLYLIYFHPTFQFLWFFTVLVFILNLANYNTFCYFFNSINLVR